ncbi:MAG: T9SS type A sorting domain-containing protein [Bacteroidota bacterium]
MKRIQRLYLLLFLLTNVTSNQLLAQCRPVTQICSDAVDVYNFPFESRLTDNENIQDFPGCSVNVSIHNPNWYRLEILSNIIELDIRSFNCAEQFGVQAALFPSCNLDNGFTAARCNCSLNENFQLYAENITPGTYYLMVDGCTGDICDYEVDLLQGEILIDSSQIVIELDTPTIVNNSGIPDNQICPGLILTVEVPLINFVDKYEWNFPPGAVLLSNQTDCNVATVIWGTEGGEVTVTAFSPFDTVQSPPLLMEIPDLRDTVYGSYCTPAEFAYEYASTFWPAGIWEVPFFTALGCDSIVTLIVTELNSPQSAFDTVFICENNPIEYGGRIIQSPGSYEITLSDTVANGCDSLVILEVEEATGFELSAEINEFICGTCDGSIAVTPIGGFLPYTYNWSDGNTSAQRSDLCPGSYQVTVVDSLGCQRTETYSLSGSTDPNQLLVEVFKSDATCGGACDGRIELQIYCGVGPFQIDWSDPSLPDDQPIVDNVCPLNHSFTITAADGSTFSGSVRIASDPPILMIERQAVDPTCAGEADGIIYTLAEGGNGVLNYSWTDGNGTALSSNITQFDLSAGNYFLTVSDTNGCMLLDSFTLVPLSDMVFDVQIENVSCLGLGSATVVASGGTSPYFYEWDNGVVGNTLNDLTEGTYTVSVTDGSGCVKEETVMIDAPISLLMGSTAAGCDSTGGTATVTVLSGAMMPEYAWSNGGTTATQSNLSPGGYSVTVTDAATGCSVHRNVIVPLDSACFVRISGFVYNDSETEDCVLDGTSQALAFQLIELSNGDFTFTNANGYYEFRVLPGTYTLDLILQPDPYELFCGGSLSVTLNDFGGVSTGNNFFVREQQTRDLGLYINKQAARPGFSQRIRFCVTNRGTETVDANLTFVHDSVQLFSLAWQTPLNYDTANYTLQWEIPNLLPGATSIITVFMITPPGTPLGTILDMYAIVTPVAEDITPGDNEVNCPFEVTGSFDPNDKQVGPAGDGVDGNITRADSLLTYQIRFQNTGTDTAFTVVLRDTLDANLDIRTLRPGPSSHDYELDVEKGNILVFTFNNIMLPDSFVNEPASNGFVFFDIQVQPGLPYGTMITNRAAIYFDFNEPIITNTVKNTLENPVSVFEPTVATLPMELLPNPNRGRGLLRYELAEAARVRVRLFDVHGRLVATLRDYEAQGAGRQVMELVQPGRQAGVYFVQLETDRGEVGVLRWVYLE